MEKIKLDAKVRTETGKKHAKELRRKGTLPAVVYKQGKAVSLELDQKEFLHILKAAHGGNVVVTLVLAKDGKHSEKTVLIKEIQRAPLRGGILHVDFNEISLTEKIKIQVPVVPKGEAVGVKADGGILSLILREVEVECLPTAIPEKIEVDVAEMKIADSKHVRDLAAPVGVKILNDPELICVTVAPPMKEEVAAPVPTEVTEVEVIREKKLTPEEQAAEEAKAKEEKKKPEAEEKK